MKWSRLQHFSLFIFMCRLGLPIYNPILFSEQQNEEGDDSSISCDDLNVDIHGTNAVG